MWKPCHQIVQGEAECYIWHEIFIKSCILSYKRVQVLYCILHLLRIQGMCHQNTERVLYGTLNSLQQFSYFLIYNLSMVWCSITTLAFYIQPQFYIYLPASRQLDTICIWDVYKYRIIEPFDPPTHNVQVDFS